MSMRILKEINNIIRKYPLLLINRGGGVVQTAVSQSTSRFLKNASDFSAWTSASSCFLIPHIPFLNFLHDIILKHKKPKSWQKIQQNSILGNRQIPCINRKHLTNTTISHNLHLP